VKDSMRGFFRLDIPAPPFPFGPLGLHSRGKDSIVTFPRAPWVRVRGW
jgi:hypothetical protein